MFVFVFIFVYACIMYGHISIYTKVCMCVSICVYEYMGICIQKCVLVHMYMCILGYSKFYNLMGFTSKKLPSIILYNVY